MVEMSEHFLWLLCLAYNSVDRNVVKQRHADCSGRASPFTGHVLMN